jgi:hypothetical protein
VREELRVILEIGKKGRRTVAGATDWPGLDRWGATEEAALERLGTYVDRYAGVADRAGMRHELDTAAGQVTVVERAAGNSSTDWWGIAHVPSALEREGISEAELERRLRLLEACWAYFDDAVRRASVELRQGPRGAGWPRDVIERHVYKNEPESFTRKVGVRTPREVVLTPNGLVAHRAATLEAIRAYHVEGRPARTWPLPFLVRRIAHHAMDHAWELEDRSIWPDG